MDWNTFFFASYEMLISVLFSIIILYLAIRVYFLAETAGPGRTNLGVITDPYQNITDEYPVKIE